MINVTYAITVCNELEEITKLVNFLHPRIKKEDEILVQYDSDSVTQEVKDYLTILSQLHTNQIKVIGFPLKNDFASFKNNLKKGKQINHLPSLLLLFKIIIVLVRMIRYHQQLHTVLQQYIS